MISSPEGSFRRTPFASVKKRHQIPTQPQPRSNYQPIAQTFRRHRLFDGDDLRASTHTVVYDSSKVTNSNSSTTASIPIRRPGVPSDENLLSKSSLGGSGNESDYDNNQYSFDYSHSMKSTRLPVNNSSYPSTELTRIDDLLLGDQNEIVLHNDTNLIGSTNFDDDEHRPSLRSTTDPFTHPLSDNSPILSHPHHHHFSTIRSTTSPNRDDSVPTTNYLAFRKDPMTTKKLLDIRSHLLLNTTLDAT